MKNKTLIGSGSTTLTTDALNFDPRQSEDWVLNYREDGIYIIKGDKTFKYDPAFIIERLLSGEWTSDSFPWCYEVIDYNDLIYKINRSVAGCETTYDGDNEETCNTLLNEILGVQHTLTLTANPENGGTVTGSGEYSEGISVEITAAANEGYEFVRWSDGNTNPTRTITISEDLALTAQFAAE